jgi:hypothetical protein
MSSPVDSGRGLLASPRLKRRLAVVSVFAALYPPLVLVVQSLLSPLAHQQDVQVCKTLYTPSGFAKQYCVIHNASPLFGAFDVATHVIFAAILVALVSGHVAVYHSERVALTTSRRTLAMVGLVLGYAWAICAALVVFFAPLVGE